MAEEQKNPEEENTVEEAVEEAVEETVDAVEEEVAPVALVEHHDEAEHAGHHYTDEVVIPYFGHIGTMPGGIYTFIFAVLAVITILEVLITTVLPDNGFTIAILVLLSLSKAYLVVMFYMHLNRDNPLYRLAIILPALIVLLSTLYLLGVPATPGLGYN